jgi:gliding motility-associated lipoprotein GldH
MMRSAPWWSVVALLLVGCAGNVVYQDSVPVPDGAWDRALAPEFAFDITDTISEHNVYIDVRHTGDYPFSDLFLFVDLWGPGDRHLRDTVECLLADPMGRWYGKGTGFLFADRHEAKVLYRLHKKFPTSGRYSIRLEQAMRTEKLPGVLDVGISVERAERR